MTAAVLTPVGTGGGSLSTECPSQSSEPMRPPIARRPRPSRAGKCARPRHDRRHRRAGRDTRVRRRMTIRRCHSLRMPSRGTSGRGLSIRRAEPARTMTFHLTDDGTARADTQSAHAPSAARLRGGDGSAPGGAARRRRFRNRSTDRMPPPDPSARAARRAEGRHRTRSATRTRRARGRAAHSRLGPPRRAHAER